MSIKNSVQAKLLRSSTALECWADSQRGCLTLCFAGHVSQETAYGNSELTGLETLGGLQPIWPQPTGPNTCKGRSGNMIFPEFIARVPVSLWGSEVEAVFAKSCVCDRHRPQPPATVRKRPQPPATVRNRPRVRRRALSRRECIWSGFESASSWLVAPQLYWRSQRRCLCEWSVSPQLYLPLQRRCLCEWSVSPQLF